MRIGWPHKQPVPRSLRVEHEGASYEVLLLPDNRAASAGCYFCELVAERDGEDPVCGRFFVDSNSVTWWMVSNKRAPNPEEVMDRYENLARLRLGAILNWHGSDTGELYVETIALGDLLALSGVH